MKKLIISLLCTLGIIYAKAEIVNVGDLYYDLNEKNLTAFVTYNFSDPDENDRFNYTQLPSTIVIPSTIEINSKTYTVTSIGLEAFTTCEQLESVSLPSSLTKIGSDAFSYTGLKSIVIPKNVESIGISAFCGCSNLTEIELSPALRKIGNNAFSYTALTTISLPEGITDIPDNAFFYSELESMTLPSTITSIGSSAFSNCKKLKEINFPESVETIGKQAFKSCTALESLYLNKVNTIGKQAFEECSALRTIDFGTGSLTIESEAFNECIGLSGIVIPENVMEIKNDVFYDCNEVKSVTIADGNSQLRLGSTPFGNCPFTDLYIGRDITGGKWNDYFSQNKSLEKVVLGDVVTSLPNRLFYWCKSIKEITFGDHMKMVGDNAFTTCDNLKRVNCKSVDSWGAINFEDTSSNPLTNGAELFVDDQLVTDVVFSDNISAVGDNAFAFYTPLKSVTLSKSITNVGDQAFYECENLEKVSIEATGITYDDRAFLKCENLREVYCNDISDWLMAQFDAGPSNPLYYGAKLFVNNELVTTLDIPEGLTYVSDYNFYNYPYLTKVVLPESVTKVGDYAFANCEAIEEISLGSHVQQLGKKAFYGENLKTIISKATTPPEFSLYPTIATFNDYTAEVLVPFGTNEVYKENKYWENFSNIKESEAAGIKSVTNEDKEATPFSINGETIIAKSPIVVYTTGGVKIGAITTDSEITLPKGIYIIKSNTQSFKVTINNN